MRAFILTNTLAMVFGLLLYQPSEAALLWSGLAWTGADGCATVQPDGSLKSSCGQILSVERWPASRPIALTGQVRSGQPPAQSSFCGLVLMQDQQVYAQALVGRNVPPPWDADYPARIHLAAYTDEQVSQLAWFGYVPSEAAWNTVKLEWLPGKRAGWRATVNGGAATLKYHLPVTGPLFVDLQGGSYGCEYRGVSVVAQALPNAGGGIA